MKIIDLNGYFGHWPHWPIKTTTVETLVQLLDRHHIDQMALISTKGVFLNSKDGLQHTLETVAQKPQRLVGFATVSPMDGEAACSLIQEAVRQGIKGLRLLPQHHQYRLDNDPYLEAILSLAQEIGLPVLIPVRLILHWGLPQLDVRELDGIAGRFPRLKLIIGGVNYGELRDALSVLRKHEQIGFETSCFQVCEGIEKLVKAIGSERIYFGSGLPLMYPAPGLAKIEHAQIGDLEKEKIFGLNAARLLSL